MEILQIAKLAAGPVIGSVIGYFTNYIAVKMLFFPKHEIRLFGKKLPFTPGVIPKGKDRLGSAIGNVVGSSLLTKDDIKAKIFSEDIQRQIGAIVSEKISKSIKKSVLEITNISEDSYSNGRKKLGDFISAEIVSALSKIDISELISTKGLEIINSKLTNPMLRMFINDDLILSILAPMGIECQKLIGEHGLEYVKPEISNKLVEIESQTPVELFSRIGISENELNIIVSAIIKNAISSGIDKIFENIDISQMVKSKIDDMSIDDLEDMILLIMKKELNTIVNLGALIGFLLGLFNIIF